MQDGTNPEERKKEGILLYNAKSSEYKNCLNQEGTINNPENLTRNFNSLLFKTKNNLSAKFEKIENRFLHNCSTLFNNTSFKHDV